VLVVRVLDDDVVVVWVSLSLLRFSMTREVMVEIEFLGLVLIMGIERTEGWNVGKEDEEVLVLVLMLAMAMTAAISMVVKKLNTCMLKEGCKEWTKNKLNT
jgi:hypothetical protein